MIEDTEILGYCAGVIDSDGCINIQKKKAGKWAANYQPRITVKQVTPQAVALLHEFLGGSTWLSGPSAQKGRPLYVWNVHSSSASTALSALLPHLRIKAEQARNAIALCNVNSRLGRRRFPVPDIVDGEPMLSIKQVCEVLNKNYATVTQAVSQGTIPFAKTKRAGNKPSVWIPESFMETWAARGSSPKRDPAITDEMEVLYLRGKELNRVGI